MPSGDRSRDRSASPTREPRTKKQKSSGGFKWKEKKSRDDEETDDRNNSGRLERGYRDRSPPRRRDRDRDTHRDDRDEDRTRSTKKPAGSDDSPSLPKPSKPTKTADDGDDLDINSKFPDSNPQPKPKKKKKPTAAPSNEPMITVNINDRLGTKAAIPCLASDSIKMFKAMVAAHIGRQPHEIMLKRQGERPFLDALSLADYGVSNGVQLDLELDTGD